MDVIKEVAEMKCPGCMSGNCPTASWELRTGDVMVGCLGTGLRWPTLSSQGDPYRNKFGIALAEGRRIPNVTLEKVLSLGWNWEIGKNDYTDPNTTWICTLRGDEKNEGDVEFFATENTALEAACAALLASLT